jgi:hypothetical protein
MFILLISNEMQIQWPKKWISYIQITHEYWSTSHNAESATMNMYSTCVTTVSERDPLHPQVRMFTAANITCRISKAFFIPEWESFLLWRYHKQNILSHQIRTFSPYCLRSIPQYATRVESSVSRHQTNKLLHPAIISCAATDYAW